LSESVGWDVLIDKVTHGPRHVLQRELPVIDIEAKANLTLLDPACNWTFDEKTNLSKSKNSPWYGKQVTGKVVAVFNNNKHWID
jgi:dihydroorotase